jgi:hypothetical protein
LGDWCYSLRGWGGIVLGSYWPRMGRRGGKEKKG